MPVSIDREIARIRGLPGQNWHALALQALQDYVNGLPAASGPAQSPSVSRSQLVIGGGAATSTSPTPAPFQLQVNGVPSANNKGNLNNALPVAGSGMTSVVWRIDNTLPVPNINGSVPSVPNFSDDEIPVDSGDHQHFTLAHSPSPAASLMLFVNGLLQQQGAGDDYTLSGTGITLAVALSGSFTILAWYRF